MDPYASSFAVPPKDADTKLQTATSLPSMPVRTVRAGDIGFLAREAVQNGIDRKHHIKTHEEVGIHVINFNRKHEFNQLPGVTFNEKSFTNYITTATTLRQTMQQQVTPLRGTSPRKAAGHY
ncbi:hypothetical protein PLESTB_000400000 [Pleodorina starrii]|uniref:Uncharacterized protein n=1 Tax=Pleodorina starrii TaxID=330485 RepID=A0A9W6BF70_9CHLO|nr:hypothetical protein PLESTM_001495500 [Pleodorina starrii]GLC50618.1 hypothetical protein PLESTB_000400000 [Pleodorina starrii]GLC75232.1 hypothetical protein PLESTF_001611600 [Pleodorina starrii]